MKKKAKKSKQLFNMILTGTANEAVYTINEDYPSILGKIVCIDVNTEKHLVHVFYMATEKARFEGQESNW